MRQETITVYSYDELPSEAAKEKARQWFLDGGLDYEWWDSTYDDCDSIFKILGIESDAYGKRRDGSSFRTGPDIAFSGFWSQGDGASFAGRYRYKPGAAKAIRAYAPQDNELHRIADDLQAFQRQHFYSIEAEMKRGTTRYCHENTIDFEVWDRNGTVSEETHDALRDIMRRLMQWIYATLEREHDYLTSDEAVAETLEANEFEFTADGGFHV